MLFDSFERLLEFDPDDFTTLIEEGVKCFFKDNCLTISNESKISFLVSKFVLTYNQQLQPTYISFAAGDSSSTDSVFVDMIVEISYPSSISHTIPK
jgi:hypothetical protein